MVRKRGRMKYKVHFKLIFDDEIEAENEYEAFKLAFHSAIAGRAWNYQVEELEDNKTDDGIKFYVNTKSEGYKEILKQVQDLSESRGSKC